MRRRWKLSAFILLVMMVAVMAALISYSFWTRNPEFSGLPSERPTETPPYRRARMQCTDKEIDEYYRRKHEVRVADAECSFAADLLAAYLEEYGTDSNVVLAAHSLFEGLAAVAMAQPRESRAPIMRVLGYPYSPSGSGMTWQLSETSRHVRWLSDHHQACRVVRTVHRLGRRIRGAGRSGHERQVRSCRTT